jgi:hypothetical protein
MKVNPYMFQKHAPHTDVHGHANFQIPLPYDSITTLILNS